MEEIPEGFTVVVMSRTEPPPEFARLLANRRIARIDEAELRCTPDEALAILRSPELEASALERIRRQSDGWVAALVLLREHLSRHGAALDASLAEGKETIFQYFAGEIFNSALPENQRALMLTAIPPSFTQAEAVALTGREDVGRLLEYLYRRHLFIDRRRGAETTYHYHALFREFLQEEMRNRLAADERRAATTRAAEPGPSAVRKTRRLYKGGGRVGSDAREALLSRDPFDRGRVARGRLTGSAHARRHERTALIVRAHSAWIFTNPSGGGRASSARAQRSAPPDRCAAQRGALSMTVSRDRWLPGSTPRGTSARGADSERASRRRPS
jgi:hypothetical protein